MPKPAKSGVFVGQWRTFQDSCVLFEGAEGVKVGDAKKVRSSSSSSSLVLEIHQKIEGRERGRGGGRDSQQKPGALRGSGFQSSSERLRENMLERGAFVAGRLVADGSAGRIGAARGAFGRTRGRAVDDALAAAPEIDRQ